MYTGRFLTEISSPKTTRWQDAFLSALLCTKERKPGAPMQWACARNMASTRGFLRHSGQDSSCQGRGCGFNP